MAVAAMRCEELLTDTMRGEVLTILARAASQQPSARLPFIPYHNAVAVLRHSVLPSRVSIALQLNIYDSLRDINLASNMHVLRHE